METRAIEIAPLAYMRGRTLQDAFVILDEAQNATTAQMKMFLTRMGLNSKAVITGDKTQIDLPRREDSGLVEIERVLKGIEGIAFAYFKGADVVRHRLVKEIIKAYAAHSSGEAEEGAA
jgi:phosphate starvation-inducible PhoH-like protein